MVGTREFLLFQRVAVVVIIPLLAVVREMVNHCM